MKHNIKKIHYVFCTLLTSAILLSGCAIYRPVIQQGQITEYEELEKLEIGMSQEQVQEILGTPLVVDAFNPDRWDYVLNVIGTQRTIIKKERVTIFFEDGVLSRIEQIKSDEAAANSETPNE